SECPDILTFDFTIVELDYFNNLSTFSPPFPPQIIFPSISPIIPDVSMTKNAWLSPDYPGYMLWFTFAIDRETGELTTFINPDSSFEMATCPCLRDFAISNLPYSMNRIGGIVDYARNSILILIDRQPIDGDIEMFTGSFIDINKTIYANNLQPLNCPDPCQLSFLPLITTGHMMLLTSEKTGRQLVLFQLLL
ncbi:MAG TPA: hypothetical protein PK228_21000, partial [Saprospiraceae bacterium]|nr:hypothetical protein [Saprospiraceae bacterium]